VRDCGHPLIANEVRVVNPVALDSPGSVIVISGSNMSGKTTYLRAVGLNALLAQAGGPGCAAELTIRRCRVRTTVRVEDDLSAGVSLFFAEVSRIRDIVTDAAKGSDGDPPVLFLLDEILHGTNAADRRQASQLVLRRLIATGSSGLITTHDPGIAELGSHGGRVVHAHFTDAVGSEQGEVTMTFDYVMKPGPATTTNALRILEALGLSGP
jgi:DNA mismatch repair ATPase MutS